MKGAYKVDKKKPSRYKNLARNQVFFDNNKHDTYDLTQNFKRDALIDEDDNPYGYIKYISSCSDEITILLPSPVVSSEIESENNSVTCYEDIVIESDENSKGTWIFSSILGYRDVVRNFNT